MSKVDHEDTCLHLLGGQLDNAQGKNVSQSLDLTLLSTAQSLRRTNRHLHKSVQIQNFSQVRTRDNIIKMSVKNILRQYPHLTEHSSVWMNFKPVEEPNNNNNNSYIALYPVKIYELAAPYIINIKTHLTIKKAQVTFVAQTHNCLP